jgi:hypothetical protein
LSMVNDLIFIAKSLKQLLKEFIVCPPLFVFVFSSLTREEFIFYQP